MKLSEKNTTDCISVFRSFEAKLVLLSGSSGIAVEINELCFSDSQGNSRDVHPTLLFRLPALTKCEIVRAGDAAMLFPIVTKVDEPNPPPTEKSGKHIAMPKDSRMCTTKP